MRALAILLAVVAFAVGCGGAGSGGVVVGGVEPTLSVAEPQSVPDGRAGVANCEDVPELRSQLVGKLGATQNPDPIVGGVLNTYGGELSEPLGQRRMYDGLHYPPKPLVEESRCALQTR